VWGGAAAAEHRAARAAFAGDSRCVLSRKGQAVALTLDHKPILFEEARRIIKVCFQQVEGAQLAPDGRPLCCAPRALPRPNDMHAHRLEALCVTTA
jgi:hypothetical protein